MTLSKSSAPRVAFVTMGCAKNEVDTAHMQSILQDAGFSLCDDPAVADAVVVNTCSFIQIATEESIDVIFEVNDLPNVEAGAPLIVAGCMPSRYGSDLSDELTEASAFVPCSEEDDIAKVIATALNLELPLSVPNKPASAMCIEDGEEGANNPVSAYVKISDGCDRFCSYCTIPYIRGRYRSYSLSDIQRVVQQHVERGVREIVLIAQDTGRWGEDFDEPSSLAHLVGDLAEQFQDIWFRVMYIQPEGITDEFIDTVVAHDNVCPYFDIPIQHVDPTLLKAMHRKGSCEEFNDLISHIRARIPEATLRTTLIAGFPGESEQQFEDLCEFVEMGNFDYVGVFAYSREEGTKAYDLPGQIPEDEKLRRAQRLQDLADSVCIPRMANRIGQTVDVLVEGIDEDGELYGRAKFQAPEVDGVVYLNSGSSGEVLSVTIEDTFLYDVGGGVVYDR